MSSSSSSIATSSTYQATAINMPNTSVEVTNKVSCKRVCCPPLSGDDLTNFGIGLLSTIVGFAALTFGISATVHRVNPVADDLIGYAQIATVAWGVLIFGVICTKQSIQPILHAVAGPFNILYGAYQCRRHLNNVFNPLYPSLLTNKV